IKLAHGFNRLSDEAEAERALRAGVLRHANDFWLNHELAMALRKVGPRGATDTVLDRTAERLGYFHTAVALRPNSPGAWLNLGVALGQLKRYAEAEGAFRRAIELKREYGSAHKNLGRTLSSAGRLEEAIVSFRRAAELIPGDAQLHYILG